MSERGVFLNLERFFSRYKDNPSAAGLANEFRSLLFAASGKNNPRYHQIIRDLYEQAIFLVEKDALDKGFDRAILELQRDLYRELECILLSADPGQRHHFAIIVPVADRPVMLRNFLESLIEQCRIFGYGGAPSGNQIVFKNVRVFVIDDSNAPLNISLIQAMATEKTAAGLPVNYVGQSEQGDILKKIPADLRKRLSGLLGDFDGDLPGHKGASVTRNIASLYLWSRLAEFPEDTLFWFIDSDEEFSVKVKSGDEIKDVPFINYFYWLDRIFASSDVEVLTGKVVGDPPVTPSVMINTFLEDVLSFLESISDAKPDDACVFHADSSSTPFSAEYHDMTRLFGYQKKASPKRYHCSLTGRHTVKDCFDDFSGRATGFFSGLHPTRTQFYTLDGGSLKTERARTVYTGNYVIRRSGLRYFLPFASLGLRMAGPTLGRILRKRLGRKFVSANLPLLHKRTLPEKFIDEFRSGIQKEEDSLDLSGEFVRQFWGDVMLFSVEDLTKGAYPEKCDEAEIAETVRKTQDRIWELYRRHQAEVSGKMTSIKKCLVASGQWWNLGPETKGAAGNFLGFCAVAGRNFGPDSAAVKKIAGQIEEGSMAEKIIRAIGAFQEEDQLLDELLEALHQPTRKVRW